ncbi:MAG TPA: AcvB/VirJ family lysyl-phosphatidylglycerol hydrolase [Gemmatimonadaceae bacterium]|nr:AcvB/VirJ family lysyl-phosphatidylglycerol hydrolase [Gemmatimonadaceae bacterium]
MNRILFPPPHHSWRWPARPPRRRWRRVARFAVPLIAIALALLAVAVLSGLASAAVPGAASRQASAAPGDTTRQAAAQGDSASVKGLPVVEVTSAEAGEPMAVLLSGDGGWVAADREMAAALAAHGIPVAGLDARAYLERARTPDETSRALAHILRHYLAAWGRARAVVIGYSRGADLAPFMISRLPEDLRRRVVLLALLGPSTWAGFQFHLVDLVATVHHRGDLPVEPEIEKLRGLPMLCIYGLDDGGALCPSLDPTLVRRISRDGGHRVKGREGAELADVIISGIPHDR